LGIDHEFQPLYLFSKAFHGEGGGRYAPTGYTYIDSDPPAFKGLINHESETSISLKVRNKKIASAKIKMQHFFRNLKKIVKPDFLSSMKQAYS